MKTEMRKWDKNIYLFTSGYLKSLQFKVKRNNAKKKYYNIIHLHFYLIWQSAEGISTKPKSVPKIIIFIPNYKPPLLAMKKNISQFLMQPPQCKASVGWHVYTENLHGSNTNQCKTASLLHTYNFIVLYLIIVST